jgi:predicted secreted protein
MSFQSISALYFHIIITVIFIVVVRPRIDQRTDGEVFWFNPSNNRGRYCSSYEH